MASCVWSDWGLYGGRYWLIAFSCNSDDVVLLIARAFVAVVVSLVWLAWRRDSFLSFRFLPTYLTLDLAQPSHVLRALGAGRARAPSAARGPDEVAALVYLDGLTVTSTFTVAKGGFGNILRGVLLQGGQEVSVAIKVLRDNARQNGPVRKFFREVSIWKTLNHRNVLPLYGIAPNVISPGILGMVCPWIDTGDLTHHLQDHPEMTLADRRSILMQIAAALQYLHSRSVVHGDLTGNNILVEGNGNILLCDFGLSKFQRNDGVELHNTSIGICNAPWAAPEIIIPSEDLDDPGVTTSSDVYSFGSVMLQVLSGKHPYHGKTHCQIILHLGLDGPSHPPRPENADLVTDALWDFMLQCWARVPSERPSIEAVGAFLADPANF